MSKAQSVKMTAVQEGNKVHITKGKEVHTIYCVDDQRAREFTRDLNKKQEDIKNEL